MWRTLRANGTRELVKTVDADEAVTWVLLANNRVAVSAGVPVWAVEALPADTANVAVAQVASRIVVD